MSGLAACKKHANRFGAHSAVQSGWQGAVERQLQCAGDDGEEFEQFALGICAVERQLWCASDDGEEFSAVALGEFCGDSGEQFAEELRPAIPGLAEHTGSKSQICEGDVSAQ